MASIDTSDEGRDKHLRTNDFFDIENHPTMTFRRRLEPPAATTSSHGDLTIRGVTRPVTFDLEVGGVGKDPWGNTKAGFTATGTINRKDFGIEWNAPLETGGVLIGDKVTIELDIEAKLEAVTYTSRLNHAVLWVRDAQASAAFYAEALGFEVVEADPAGRAVFLRGRRSDNHHDLGLFSVGDRPSAPPQAPGPVPPGLAGRHDRGPRGGRRRAAARAARSSAPPTTACPRASTPRTPTASSSR